MTPLFRPQFRTPKLLNSHATVCDYEACISWAWWNALEQQGIAAGDCVLRVNLDETSVSLGQAGQRGVVLPSTGNTDMALVPKKNPHRGAVTHVAMICDDAAVQPLLPQFIIANEHLVRKADLPTALGFLLPNVYLLRQKSGWVDTSVFCQILQVLKKSLLATGTPRRILLLLDACTVHLHALSLQTARRLGIRLCFIPTKMTWLLQPLDSHVFARYKCYIRQAYTAEQLRSDTGFVTTIQLIRIINDAIRYVLQASSWATAFDHNGYGDVQQQLTSRVLKIVRSTPDNHAPALPTLTDLECILPRKRMIKRNVLCWDVDAIVQVPVANEPPAVAAAASGGQMSSSSSHHHEVGQPHDVALEWAARLRPRGISDTGHRVVISSQRESQFGSQ